jgi:peptidoglycan hydrolase-like protein with peptidoglycan-binding domain
MVGRGCVAIANSIGYRDRDYNRNGEVSILQDFLQARGYLNTNSTGYFGLLTQRGLRNFQRDNGINATGYFGSITRAKVRTLTACGWSTSGSPVISGVSGPQSLNVNETGTWTVNATDSSNGNLSYSVNWGDAMIYNNGATATSQYLIQQSATFTHAYSYAGRFSPTFTVTNANGKSASTSLSVNVGGGISNSSITVLTPNGGETLYRGNNFQINWTAQVSGCGTGGMLCPTAQPYYDISLVSYYPPCNAGIPCPLMAIRAPYTIAQNVSGSSYNWQVGNIINNVVSGTYVPSGLYTIQVCQTGTGMCDSSDGPFTIQ